MKGFYKNKYRIASARHPNWDYGGDSAYFITICTQNRTHFFGEISGGNMQLSPIGEFAQQCWDEIPIHFPFVELGAFVVMPNHIHGIIIINKNKSIGDTDDDKTTNNCDPHHDHHPVETQNFASLPPSPTNNPSSPPTNNPSSPSQPPSPQSQPQKNKFGPQSQNLASIVRGYKIGVTKSAKKIDPNWQWQPRYHDHIIRNMESFKRITTYIINNPRNWNEDRFY